MAVFDSNTSGPLLEQFKAAQDAEDRAIRTVRTAQEMGTDSATLIDLINQMTEIHNKKMSIWNQLEEQKLDKR